MLHFSSVNLTKNFDYSSPQTSSDIIIDSGASGTYLPNTHARYISYNKSSHKPVSVRVANGRTITSTNSGSLNIGPIKIHDAHILPQLHSPLLSVRDICDQNLKILFDKHKVEIYSHDNRLLVTNPRTTEFWTLPLIPPILTEPATIASPPPKVTKQNFFLRL